MPGPSANSVGKEGEWCFVEDPRSVESRFGLRRCWPSDTGGYRCEFVAPQWLRGGDGQPLRGSLAVLADHVLGELAYRRRQPNMWSLTAELAFDVVADLPAAAEVLVAEAVAVSTASDPFMRCQIGTADGTVVVVGNARMVYVPAPARENRLDLGAGLDSPIGDTSVDGVLGLKRSLAEDGCRISITNPGRWVNAFGIVHGGVTAAVSEFAAAEAVRARNPALATAHVHTSFLRPVGVDAVFVATARLLHIGRSSAVTEVFGRDGSGELCTVSMVTSRATAGRQALDTNVFR